MFDIEDRTNEFLKSFLENYLTDSILGFSCPVYLEFDENRPDGEVTFPCVILSISAIDDVIPNHGFYEVEVEILVQTDIIDDRNKVQHRSILSKIRESMLENNAESLISSVTPNCTVSCILDQTTSSRSVDDGIREDILNYLVTWSPIDEG